MITYKKYSEKETAVLLENKIVGNIVETIDGFKYFPKGSKHGGDTFASLQDVKNSLENQF